MASIISAVLGDLISRSISFAVGKCYDRRREGTLPDNQQRLRRVLLRIQATVEEAERRRVTNQAMLRQLQVLREGMYRGYYLLNAIDKTQDREGSRHGHSSFALSEFNPAKRLCILPATTTTTTTTTVASYTGREAEAKLREVLVDLERMAGDMKELVLLLSCYPLLLREPCSTYQWVENRMFGREAEQERIVSFLLEPPGPPGAGTQDLGVLPVFGRTGVGKSTLVEHVCCDERVRSHFSRIVFFSKMINAMDENLHLPLLGYSGAMRHRNDLASTGSSLVVIELHGDVEESTWRRTLSTLLKGEGTAPVSKIVVTGRSEKIAVFGTVKALELKPLPREAFWYFFKMIALGSTDAGEQPELTSVSMELADQMNGSFTYANVIGGLLRGNLGAPFWHKVLKRIKDHTNMHLLLFGEHPSDLIAKDRPVYLWRLPRADSRIVVYSCYQECSSAPQHDLPKITAQDVHAGRATPRGKFEILLWRSHIPPCYSYVLRCGVQTPSSSPALLVPFTPAFAMEALVSAVVGDLISRTIFFAVDRCCHRRRKAGGTEDGPQRRLRRLLLRVQVVVEEADRRHVTNQAMLRQLQLMRGAVYRGYYLLTALSRRRHHQSVVMQDKAAQDREVSRHDRSFALSQFNPAKRLCTSIPVPAITKTTTTTSTRHEGDAEAELEEVLDGLERMASDMKELAVFLSCYPPTRREPYRAHLWLEKRMFGREDHRLLAGARACTRRGRSRLPVIGRAGVGKSTLVEHVCLDDRVRSHFSLIVFFGKGNVVKHGDRSPRDLGDSRRITKHRDPGSAGKSLVIIELAGEVDELHSWWRRTLSTLTGRRTSPAVSKIIVMSRSEKIASLGTTQALELKLLPREAYWYFFKTIAFGSMDAEDQPELGSVCMEMADQLNRSFIGANLFGGLLRANPCPRFWHKVLKGFKHYTSMHRLLFGASIRSPTERSASVLVEITQDYYYQSCSGHHHDMPKITLNDVHIGSATPPPGQFQLLAWRSHIPPCYSYFLNCRVQTSSTLLHIPPENKQNRHRQARLNSILLKTTSSVVLVAYSYYQLGSGQHQHDMPKITLNDVHIGSATP
ncbi:hypothetical protein U9M48_017891 [Paspalum notatum var. saurae]|uniref:NB-ARC domain-containing protein n=1 Tax=Paspalum notatum var. saurae TaxID=547442 RepID=A0AAQ3WPZ2_PASNO